MQRITRLFLKPSLISFCSTVGGACMLQMLLRQSHHLRTPGSPEAHCMLCRKHIVQFLVHTQVLLDGVATTVRVLAGQTRTQLARKLSPGPHTVAITKRCLHLSLSVLRPLLPVRPPEDIWWSCRSKDIHNKPCPKPLVPRTESQISCAKFRGFDLGRRGRLLEARLAALHAFLCLAKHCCYLMYRSYLGIHPHQSSVLLFIWLSGA